MGVLFTNWPGILCTEIFVQIRQHVTYAGASSIAENSKTCINVSIFLKWGALSFKLTVLKKTHIWTPFNVYIYLDDALLFQNKENKILFGPPKRLKDTNGRVMSTRTSVCLYNQPVTWIFTRSRLSTLSNSDYKVIPSLKNIIEL